MQNSSPFGERENPQRVSLSKLGLVSLEVSRRAQRVRLSLKVSGAQRSVMSVDQEIVSTTFSVMRSCWVGLFLWTTDGDHLLAAVVVHDSPGKAGAGEAPRGAH